MAKQITQEFIDGLSARQLEKFRKDNPGHAARLTTGEALDSIQTAVECYIEDSLGKGRNLEYIDEIDELEQSWSVITNQIARLKVRISND